VARLGKCENRESVYEFVPPTDERNLIFERWLNRDESARQSANSNSVSVTSNINTSTPIIDTTPHDIPQTDYEAVVAESSSMSQSWKGLKLKLQQGLENAGKFYQQLVTKVGEAVRVADGEPVWNQYQGCWQVIVSFACGCKSVVCDWLVAA
jgi:hypothetical protein